MQVILKETIESLGIIGTEVNVAKGYARNYLLPQGKAILANPANRALMKQQKARVEMQIAKEKAFAEEMAAKLAGITCTIAAKVSDEDRLYGSIGVRDIIDAMDKLGIGLEKRMVLLSEPIRTLGTFPVPIRVYKGVEPEINVTIVPE